MGTRIINTSTFCFPMVYRMESLELAVSNHSAQYVARARDIKRYM